ncbi:MAG: hypothetical protein ABI120_01075 [Gemmatimonadaceae bacterium]
MANVDCASSVSSSGRADINASASASSSGAGSASASAPSVAPAAATQNAPPALVVGDFEDDYGARFSITAQEFFQRSRNHFHIVRWNVRDQYFIAQNDSLNPSDPNKWTRIDWVPLSGMAPFEWAFCFSAYKAPTRAEAEATSTARRETLKTGCNGFPFSRMKRTTSAPQ